jgi:hypothetical protein
MFGKPARFYDHPLPDAIRELNASRSMFFASTSCCFVGFFTLLCSMSLCLSYTQENHFVRECIF